LYYIDSFPESIKKFLNDQNVCFVGVGRRCVVVRQL
jgi:hypothetical protein